ADCCIGIIDLGDMIHAPRVFEIAVAMAEFLADGITPLSALWELLAGYAGGQPLQSEEIGLLPQLVAARIAAGILIEAWRRHEAGRGAGANPLEEPYTVALSELALAGQERLAGQWLNAARGLLS